MSSSNKRHCTMKYYKIEINKTEWEVPDRYQMLTPVGLGAYGQVWYACGVNQFPTHQLSTYIVISFFFCH